MKSVISSTIERYSRMRWEVASWTSQGARPCNSARSLSGKGAGLALPTLSSSIIWPGLTLASLTARYTSKRALYNVVVVVKHRAI